MDWNTAIPPECDITIICSGPVSAGKKDPFRVALAALRPRRKDMLFVVPDNAAMIALHQIAKIPILRIEINSNVRDIGTVIHFRGRKFARSDGTRHWGSFEFRGAIEPTVMDRKTAQRIWSACGLKELWAQRP